MRAIPSATFLFHLLMARLVRSSKLPALVIYFAMLGRPLLLNRISVGLGFR